jgi:hypothetical protein
MRSTFALLLLVTAALPGPVHAQVENVPPELRGWEDWVLDGREHLRCPFLGGADTGSQDGRLCVWPGPVVIDAGAAGARFAQSLRVYAPGFLPLPGDGEAWPQDVEVDGRAAPVIERDGRPQLRLEPGTHRVTGRLVWARLPEAVTLPGSFSLVELTVNGTRIALPERSGESLRLGATREQAQVDRLDVQVYRKLTDSLPGMLQTRLNLNVAGRPREELIGPLLPTGFVPTQLVGPLPARLQPDGRLRVQVRPGNWILDLQARGASALETVRVPESGIAEEVWSFEPVDRLRSAAVEGVPGIDPTQANVPAEWQSLPAYRLAPGAEFTVTERSRGAGGEDRNQIEVERRLWWDFDGTGYTFQDFVGGRMQQDWRLEMSAPWRLQGARQNEQALLVTLGEDDRAGVELRSPELGVEATGRLEKRRGAITAAGWNTRLASLGINLQLPPGHRLLAAPGVDVSASAWLNRWRLLDIFAVLLVTAVAFRVAGVPAAVLSLVAFTLTHHELPALTWAALNLLVAIGLARAVPEGKVRDWVGVWRAVSIAVVVVMLVPFALSQARLAFFPQLAPTGLEQIVVTGARPQSAREAAAPPPVQGELMESDDRSTMEAPTTAITTTTARPDRVDSAKYAGVESVLGRYAPGTQLQHGPGVPRWNYQSHRLQWSGPVEPSQRMRLIVLTPIWVSLWRIAGIVFAALALYAMVRNAYPRIGQPQLDRWLRIAPTTVAVLLSFVLPLLPPAARAQMPAPELLEELQRRLSRPPKCAPDCVSIARAQLSLADGSLEIRLEAHAQALAVLALPEAGQRWQPGQVLLDGAPAGSLARDATGTLVLALPAGVHAVTLRGAVPDTEALRLAFRERPARIEVDAPGWQVAGVDDGRLIADSVSLIRPVQSATRTGADAAAAQREEFPPFVRVTRALNLGLDWTVSTDVERLAPADGAFTVRLPLLPGESVLTAGLPVHDHHVEVAMPAGVAHAGWTSALARSDSLALTAPTAAPYVEVWRFAVSPIWHLRFDGTPEVLGPQPEGPAWVHHFEPRPSERLSATVTRPAAVAGPTFAFEGVRHALTPGRRSTDTTLQIDYRSTQGGRHVIGLPEGARLRSVLADGAPLALRDEDGKLALPLQPGAHQLQIDWQTDVGISLVTRPGAVALGAPASNVRTTIAVPESRWLLFAAGGGVGPAILYWAELAVFIVLALLLGRLGRTPLATHEWLLVGLGLSTFSWSVLLLFAVWVFAFHWRGRWAANVKPLVFNGVQLALAVLTIIALGSLLAAIPNGLLGSPDMRVAGAGSQGGLLEWFHDRVGETLPRPVVISVSIWFYKAAMLAWALWLSFALTRWVRWAWQAGSAQGLWRGGRAAAGQIG